MSFTSSIQLVADTAQLAKITNSPIQKLRLQSRTLTVVSISVIVLSLTWTDGWMDGWMDEWMDKMSYYHVWL